MENRLHTHLLTRFATRPTLPIETLHLQPFLSPSQFCPYACAHTRWGSHGEGSPCWPEPYNNRSKGD